MSHTIPTDFRLASFPFLSVRCLGQSLTKCHCNQVVLGFCDATGNWVPAKDPPAAATALVDRSLYLGTKTLGAQLDSSFSSFVVSPGSVSLSTVVSLLSRGGICSVIGVDWSCVF